MLYVLYLLTIIISIILFLKIIRIKENFTVGLKKIQGAPINNNKSINLTQNIGKNKIKRICPLCQSELSKDEFLYCAMSPENKSNNNTLRQVQIYGCKYCYGDKNFKLNKL